jgi:hypothetical protein
MKNNGGKINLLSCKYFYDDFLFIYDLLDKMQRHAKNNKLSVIGVFLLV